MADFTYTITGLDDIKAMLSDSRVKSGLKSGMRRIGNKAKTIVSKGIRQTYNIKKADLDKRFNARIDPGMTTITLKGKHIGLINFINPTSLKMRSKRPARIGAKITKQGTILKPYVQVKVLKDKGYTTLDHAFVAITKSNRFGIFERVGKSRLPIKYLYGPSVAQMGANKNIKAELDKMVATDAVKILRHAVAWKTGGEIEE